MVSRALYRVGQLRRALNPHVTDSERDAAREALGPQLYPLFESMAAPDQRHCTDLFETLLRGGHTDAEMLKAALIHDCGKGSHGGAHISVVSRITYVLLTPAPPLIALAARFSPGMRALREHGERTLQLARAHGASVEVISLLEMMEGVQAADERGLALKRADDAT